jgi:hypothetical protein
MLVAIKKFKESDDNEYVRKGKQHIRIFDASLKNLLPF